jgi:hypothetical protein
MLYIYYRTERNTPMDTIVSTTSSTVLLATAAEAAVLAKNAKKAATDLFANAENDLITLLLAAGVETVTLADGTKVTLKGGLEGEEGRSIDVDLLAERVPAATLAKVTKPVIDLKAFDAAVEVGLIDTAVVDEVTTSALKKRSVVITVPTSARR